MTLKFGTDGIRGPVDTVVTAEACLRIGQAVGIVAKEEGWNTVMIGKDTRVSGYMLESALQAGFIASGINVRLLGPIPTPGVAYLSKSFRDHFVDAAKKPARKFAPVTVTPSTLETLAVAPLPLVSVLSNFTLSSTL